MSTTFTAPDDSLPIAGSRPRGKAQPGGGSAGAEVRVGTTRSGDEHWSLRLVVADGPQIGRQAAWDSIVFSRRGLARARLVFTALGLPASGRVEVVPDDLVGRAAMVEVRPAEYQGPEGEIIRRNEVPYDGRRTGPST